MRPEMKSRYGNVLECADSRFHLETWLTSPVSTRISTRGNSSSCPITLAGCSTHKLPAMTTVSQCPTPSLVLGFMLGGTN